MPIYEYRCEACRARLSVLARTVDAPPPPCTRCGGAQVTRLLSRFAAPRSEEARIEAPADPSDLEDVDGRVASESGDDLGDEFEGDIERAAKDISGEGDPGAEAFPGANDSGASDE